MKFCVFLSLQSAHNRTGTLSDYDNVQQYLPKVETFITITTLKTGPVVFV